MSAATLTRANDQPKTLKKEVVLIVRHETGRVHRGSVHGIHSPRAAQVRGGRIVDEGVQGVAGVAPGNPMTLGEQAALAVVAACPLLLCELAWAMGWF